MDTEDWLVIASGVGWSGRLGIADGSFYIYRMDKQHSLTTEHKELYIISYEKP